MPVKNLNLLKQLNTILLEKQLNTILLGENKYKVKPVMFKHGTGDA